MVNGLLGDFAANPLLNIGAGLLSVAGPSFQPQSLGQGLMAGLGAANQAQLGAAQNQLIRERITASRDQREQEARRQAAFGRLREGLLSAGEVEPGTGNVAGLDQRQMLGLLAEAAPDQFAQGLLAQVFPQERSEPSLLRNIRALNDPTLDEEQRDILRKNISADPAATDQMLRALDLQMRQIQLQNEMRNIDREDLDERRSRAQLVVDLRSDLNSAVELADLNDRLENTALETGLPMSEMRRLAAGGVTGVASVLGVDASEARRMVADFDRFEKLATDFAVKSATRMFERGQITNLQLQAIRDASVSPFVAPDANRQVIADSVERLLSAAEIEGIEIANRDRFDSLIPRLRGRSRPDVPEAAPSGGRVIDFNDLPAR